MCCAINIRIAGTKYFCIQFLAKHLKLKITITFNLAQRTNILHCVSRQCWFVYQPLAYSITICPSLSLSVSLPLSLSFLLYAKVVAKTKKVAAALLYLPLATWRRSRQQNFGQLGSTELGAAHKTQVCHLPSWHAPKCPAGPLRAAGQTYGQALKNSLSGK